MLNVSANFKILKVKIKGHLYNNQLFFIVTSHMMLVEKVEQIDL